MYERKKRNIVTNILDKHYKLSENELVLLIDCRLNYLAYSRMLLEEENFIDARRKIIKAFWPEVPDRHIDSTIACAEHLLKDYEVIE